MRVCSGSVSGSAILIVFQTPWPRYTQLNPLMSCPGSFHQADQVVSIGLLCSGQSHCVGSLL